VVQAIKAKMLLKRKFGRSLFWQQCVSVIENEAGDSKISWVGHDTLSQMKNFNINTHFHKM